MVICKFFQQGYCRFGSKCSNEHFDVKQIIKSDMETAINGKQWPLSCYGPFKDKPCLPNFIEDQSFEEMRNMCYNSKKRNYYAQFHREFNRRVVEATQKMNAMPTQQIIDVAANIYDTPAQDSKQIIPLFGTANNTTVNNANQNVFGSNIFNTNNNTASAATGNIFGNSNAAQQQQQQQQQQQPSIFGPQANSNQVNAFSFSNANNNNIFAQNDNQKSAVGIFAQAAQQNAGSGVGIFTPVQQNQSQGLNIFQQQQNTNSFAQNAFNQAQPEQQQQNAFAQAPQAMNTMASQPASNIFSQPNQSTNNTFTNPSAVTATTNVSQHDNVIQQQQMQNASMHTEGTTKTAENVLFSSVYSRLEDLTSEEIEAFQANMFLPGKIPCTPPPRNFV